MTPLLWLGAICALLWLINLLVPWRPWSTRERLEAEGATESDELHSVTVLIPARDEAAVIGRSLSALAAQGPGLRILVIDDESRDGTAEISGLAPGVQVLPGAPLPPGWTGKLWALEQGYRASSTPRLLLLDADIELAPGLVSAMLDQMRRERVALLSLMAQLRMRGIWERLLMPAFVYFFKLLYPFRLANSRFRGVAAAAGGCVLIEKSLLDTLGGFAPMRAAIIDDCTLARHAKRAGFATWIGLTRSARSLRPYTDLGSVWNMVARTAFTQLRYSPTLLALCTASMLVAFWGPPLLLVTGPTEARALALTALAAMVASYAPLLHYYVRDPETEHRRPGGVLTVLGWALSLPLAASLFLAMTWSSAVRYWRGTRSAWKGRVYRASGASREPGPEPRSPLRS